jgi:hypothetical protein
LPHALQPNRSGQFVRPSSIHSNPFDIANANQLKAHIIAAIPLIGKLHQLPGRGFEVNLSAGRLGQIGRRERSMQAVGTQQKDIAGKQQMLANVGAHE